MRLIFLHLWLIFTKLNFFTFEVVTGCLSIIKLRGFSSLFSQSLGKKNPQSCRSLKFWIAPSGKETSDGSNFFVKVSSESE